MAAFLKCPVCGSVAFYVRDPEDEFETHEFTLAEGKAVCADALTGTIVAAAAESRCSRCTWHGRIPGVNRG